MNLENPFCQFELILVTSLMNDIHLKAVVATAAAL
jgi:hypothetical protein